jgi:hypothetical protein
MFAGFASYSGEILCFDSVIEIRLDLLFGVGYIDITIYLGNGLVEYRRLPEAADMLLGGMGSVNREKRYTEKSCDEIKARRHELPRGDPNDLQQVLVRYGGFPTPSGETAAGSRKPPA